MCVGQVRFGNRLEEIEKMKKKIMAVMLSLVLVLGMIPISNVLAQTKGAKFTVEASKTTANPGDEITFSIYVEDAIPFTGIEIVLGETEGLTYVANSGKIVSGLKEQMGFAEASFTELIPMTSPFILMRAPPLFPGLMAASVWISLLVITLPPAAATLTSRSNALTIPVVVD